MQRWGSILQIITDCFRLYLQSYFAGIDEAKTNTEKNLRNAKELFESYLQGIFSQHHGLNGLKDSTEKKSAPSAQSAKISDSDKWEEKGLGEIAEVEYGFTDKASEKEKYRYIRITDIDKNAELIQNDRVYIKDSNDLKAFIAADNDLLMARTGATFGKVLLYKDYEPSVFASYLTRIKFCIGSILICYLLVQLNHQFDGTALKEILFLYPKSLSEQKHLLKNSEYSPMKQRNLKPITSKN